MSTTMSFPEDKRDAIDQALRASIEPGPLKSVRQKPNTGGPKATITASTEMPAVPKTVKTVIAPSSPVASADAISIDLPSKFHYYSFKDLYVKPFRAPHLAKLAKGRDTGSLQIQVEAVSSVLSTSSGETNLAFKLTTADYNAVLYWLRLTSFSKPTIRVTTLCKNKKHHKEVEEGTRDKGTLLVETVYTKSDLKYDYLEEAPNPELFQVMLPDDPSPKVLHLQPETMADTIAFLDSDNWTDEEFQYKSKIAATLGGIDALTGHAWTWEQKIQLVDEVLTADQAVLCEEFSSAMDLYGVREIIEVTCKECGFKGYDQIACDPQTFLAPRF